MALRKRRNRRKPARLSSIFAKFTKKRVDDQRTDRQLRAEFASSPQGQLLQQAERLARRKGPAARREAESLARRIEEMQRQGLTADADITRLLNDIGSAGDRAAFMGMLLKPFGPVGKFVGAMLGSRTKWSQDQVKNALGTAVNLLGALNPELLIGGPSRTPEQQGFRLVEPGGSARVPATEAPTPAKQPGDQFTGTSIRIQVGNESMTVRADDPIVTGKMIRVKNSSNVHSVGYRIDWDNPSRSAMLVRYLGRGNPRSGPGPLYEYIGVPPRAFREAAAIAQSGSTGTGVWVWDTLRKRGSQVAHQYEWHLIGIANGHVPRRAGYKNGQEWWLRRSATINAGARTGKVLQSLPSRPINGRPANGRPGNGRPSDGRPGG